MQLDQPDLFAVTVLGQKGDGPRSRATRASTETSVIEYREGSDPGHVRKLAGLNKFTNIVLKRGITLNRELWQWRKNIMDGTMDRRNGAIVILADDRTEVARINFVSGWPSKWEGPHLNATSSDVAIETLEIAHEGIDLV